ncbi:MAG TPA: hypothetical protein VG122_17825 [Gemmata sp.]|jgi:hypothetical protein|nr:hypothetical protein [Gemmata sp.]
MKNFLILGLTALLLFSISAALSLWLNQGRYATDTSLSTEKAGKKNSSEKEATEPHPQKTEPKAASGLGGVDPDSFAKLTDRERRLSLRADEINIILKDVLAQRDVIDTLIRQMVVELKTAEGRVGDLEVRTAELEKKKIDFDAAERKNIERIAGLLDAMAPESAAATLKQMADSGKMEVAAKVLILMKDRNAARALGELGDPALSAQLLDKIRLLKSATSTPTPRPGGTVPAGGVPPTVFP